MKIIESLRGLLPIIYPSFYTLLSPSLDELVFLDVGDRLQANISEAGIAIGADIGNDKTRCEATNNHFHLFNKIREVDQEIATEIGKTISQNLLRSLMQTFPHKRFIVFLEVNIKDSTIIRFHQIWSGELPYLDVKQSYQNGLELFEFRA